MAQQVKVPAVGESITEVTIANWLKKDGDSVKMDEVIAELEELGIKARSIATEGGLKGYEIRHYRRVSNCCIPEVLDLFFKAKISFSLAKVIASIPRDKQEKTARDAIAKKISVHTLRAKLAHNENNRLNNDLAKMANKYSEITGLDICIHAATKNPKAGYWKIKYEDLDMFDIITDRIIGKCKDDYW